MALDARAALAGATDARRVDQGKGALGSIEVGVDGVPSRAGDIAHDDTVLADEGVHKRGLADVGPSDDGHAHTILLDEGRGLGETPDHLIKEEADVQIVQGGDGERRPEAKGAGLGGSDLLASLGVGLGGDEDGGGLAAAHGVGHVVVAGGEAITRIDAEEDEGGLGDGGVDLGADQVGVVAFVLNLEAAGVEQKKGAVAPLDLGFETVARGAGLVLDDGEPFADDAVEERRLADVGAAHDGDTGKVA